MYIEQFAEIQLPIRVLVKQIKQIPPTSSYGNCHLRRGTLRQQFDKRVQLTLIQLAVAVTIHML